MTSIQQPRILVTGATGNVGREVVAQLTSRGVPVRAASRHPAPAGGDVRVQHAAVDLADLSTVEPALADVDAVYLMWPFFESGEEARRKAEPLAELLGRRVRRVVYLSSQTADEVPDGFWGVVERALETQVAEWTMLRPTGFAVNTHQWADQIRRGDVVRWPFGRASRPLIHERDMAAVAVAALLEDGHSGQRPVITGPQHLSQERQVEIIGAAIGRELRWEELDRDRAARELELPEQLLDAWESFLTHPEPLTGEVQRITGQPARSFTDWAREHAGDFTGADPRTA